MSVIQSELIIDPSSVWSPVNIKLTNTYSNTVDINGLTVTFLNPYPLNGVPWGIDGIESTDGSLSGVSTPIESAETKTQITLHWPSTHTINSNQSVTLAFNLTGEVHEADFTGLHADLKEDPTATLSFSLQAPPPPSGTTTEQVEVIVKYPVAETSRDILISFENTVEVDHLFSGIYNIYPQPVKVENATYYPKNNIIPFNLTSSTSGETVTLEYQTNPQYTVPVVFQLASIGYNGTTTNIYLDDVAYPLTFGSSSIINLTADKAYTISFDITTINNVQYVVDYSNQTYTPSTDVNQVSLPVRQVSVNTDTFIRTLA